MTAISTIEQHAEKIRNGQAKVHPGQSHRISDAAQPGDGYAQGDFNVILTDKIPNGYVKVEEPRDADRQLVPGTTQGARHCLDSLDGVDLYRHPDWNSNYEGLYGPAFILKKERTITHPTHGNLTIPADRTILTTYQPNWDEEERRERRNVD